VDSHHHRVARRTGLIAPSVGVGASHAVLESYLPADWDAQRVYDHHQLFMRHGQRVCHWRRPDCGGCAVAALCDARAAVRNAMPPSGDLPLFDRVTGLR
jgi:endonuclease-3